MVGEYMSKKQKIQSKKITLYLLMLFGLAGLMYCSISIMAGPYEFGTIMCGFAMFLFFIKAYELLVKGYFVNLNE